jgi:Transposase family tnp2
MLRHPGDSPEWRNINRIFKDFGDEPRNLRLGLRTDWMNPYGLMSSGNTTWHVLLCIYNIPLVMHEKKYIMLLLLISGPKQSGNYIDVYLAPLLEDLNKLWKDGVRIFDAYLK